MGCGGTPPSPTGRASTTSTSRTGRCGATSRSCSARSDKWWAERADDRRPIAVGCAQPVGQGRGPRRRTGGRIRETTHCPAQLSGARWDRTATVDLNEAAQRIFKFHWVLILLTVMVGVSIPALLFGSTGASYLASSRLVIGAEDARDGQQAAALADTALALATSPAVLGEALGAAGVQRDPSEVAEQVSVDPVGSSGVLQLSVTDPDPSASASIANALAAVIVQ